MTHEQRNQLLQECTADNFDGHTEFSSLSPVQKLQWLGDAVYFSYTMWKENPSLECGHFFKLKQDIV